MALSSPLLNSCSSAVVFVECSRIIVPTSLALAITVPVRFSAKQRIGPLWARIMVTKALFIGGSAGDDGDDDLADKDGDEFCDAVAAVVVVACGPLLLLEWKSK